MRNPLLKAVILTSFFMGGLFGETNQPQGRSEPYFSQKNSTDYNQSGQQLPASHHIIVGPSYTRAYLKPSANPSFSGNLWGLQASYAYQRPNFFYGALEFEWRYGTVHASNGKRDLQDIIGEERLGYTLKVSPRAILTFFSGFGFRQFWHDVKLKKMKSIDLRYNHFYIPLGIYSHFYPDQFFSFGVNATWYAQVFPTLTIGSLTGARWKLQRRFANFLVEIPLIFSNVGVRNLSILLVPQFEVWQDGKTTARSASGVVLGMPKNNYIFWGGEVNVKYSF